MAGRPASHRPAGLVVPAGTLGTTCKNARLC
jgi:hypothetical protein